LHFKSNIYTYAGETPKPGKTGTFQTSNWFGGTMKLSFINGIMVGASSDGSDVDDLTGTTLPSMTGHVGDVLVATTTAPEWKTLNASLVNFSNTTVTLTDASSGVYTVSIPYTKVTSSSSTAYTGGHYVSVYAN
jgi:hypothetical protein